MYKPNCPECGSQKTKRSARQESEETISYTCKQCKHEWEFDPTTMIDRAEYHEQPDWLRRAEINRALSNNI